LNIEAKDITLDRLLKEAFKSSDYNYAIDGNRVFLLKGAAIKTNLSAALGGTGNIDQDYAFMDSLLQKNRGVTKSVFKNKQLEVGIRTNEQKPGLAKVTGVVRDLKTGYPLKGISVFTQSSGSAAVTDSNGRYVINLPKGRQTINAKGLGKIDLAQPTIIYSDGVVDLLLDDVIPVLEEVVVSADRIANVNRVQMGVERLTIKTIKQMPAVFGEADILRAVLTLPGVKSVGEASTGFNVRGGASDQNLILFNDATIYNPSHFFGFFSAFNPEIVKEVELYKSSIPAKYGGRLASVLDVTGREGNKEKITGSAGIGLLTSRINIEGPINKNRSSFNFGGRTTYSNWLLKLLPDKYDYKNSKASFYDVNLLTSHTINKNNNLYITLYGSKDRFNLNSDTTFGYSNRNVSLKWKHIFNDRLTGFFVAGNDHYEYVNQSDYNPIDAYKMAFNIDQRNIKGDFNYNLDTKHKIDAGFSSIYYQLQPGSFQPNSKESLVKPQTVQQEQALESAIYISDRYDVNQKLSLNPGIRYSIFNYLGPQAVDEYPSHLPKTDANRTGTTTYNRADVIKTYQGAEFRMAARYAINRTLSVKAAYNTLRQYIHMLSNTAAISPTDIWKLSDKNIEPQLGDQVSLGFYKNLKADTIELSVEIYKKRLRNYLDYKNGAVLVLNDHIETDVFKTKGNAYGAEIMIKKRSGKLNGWMSYTYSRILLKVDDSNAGETINNGDYYPANYDKPHDFTLIGNYRINQRFSISLNATYSTGRPITVPIGRFFYAGSERTLYSERNTYRIPDYFRTDFSMNIDGNHKVHQRTHNSWTIGLYNATGRRNPYSVYYTSEDGVVNGYKLSIFGSAIPFINFNIRF
ncbi:MAG TPA: TonB-dependent receptor, partial [Chitinophagaceae bacterium]|nr:TonB-dependent receptor [Chitinophagaceae bacterium]